jgi:hypothetical protein
MPTISNSEVDTFLQCRRRHYYRFGLGLEPVSNSLALDRGLIGHKALEHYYIAKHAGKDKDECIQAAHTYLNGILITDLDNINLSQVIFELKRQIIRYAEHRWDEPWDIISVEQEFRAPIGEDLFFGMKTDLVVRLLTGEHKGNIVVVDHKWTYNFWSPDDFKYNVQIPKYVATIKGAGTFVSRGIINEIRYRELKNPTYEDEFRRTPIIPSGTVLRAVMAEQVVLSEKIAKIKRLPVAEQSRKATRNMNKNVCKFCPFKGPCYSELQGLDVSTTLATRFRPSTYGYDNDVPDRP